MLKEKHFVLKFMAASQVSMLAIEYGYISQGVSKDLYILPPFPES